MFESIVSPVGSIRFENRLWLFLLLR